MSRGAPCSSPCGSTAAAPLPPAGTPPCCRGPQTPGPRGPSPAGARSSSRRPESGATRAAGAAGRAGPCCGSTEPPTAALS
eukprot:scaffold649898_cov34-Prasinocladus_malaysianus.AAC.1